MLVRYIDDFVIWLFGSGTGGCGPSITVRIVASSSVRAAARTWSPNSSATSAPPSGSPIASARNWAGPVATTRSASPISSATPSMPSTPAILLCSASLHAAATSLRNRAPPSGARRRHPANLSLQARRRTRCAAPQHSDPYGWRQAAEGDRELSALPVHLPRQPRHPAHQQRLRASAAALRRLPQGHQLLPLGMGRQPLRRHPLRHRNRPSQSHRRSRRHSGNPERLAARRNADAIDNQPNGVSSYR